MEFMKKLGMASFMIGMLAVTSNLLAAPVNINTADANTLAANIKGVGPKKAQAIVIYRRDNGPFKSIYDLAKVKGIGDKLIARNKSDLLISDKKMNKARK